MNARSSSRVSLTINLCAAMALLFLTGCSLFQSKEEAPAAPVKQGVISAKRTQARKTSRTMLCLIAEQGRPFSHYDEESELWQGAEPEIVRAIAEKLKLEVIFVPVPAAALASALRNGRGDLAIGKLTASRIAAWHQTAVFPYASGPEDSYALMIRSDDIAWKSELEKAAAGIDGAALLKANAKDLKPIAVDVVEKENSGEVISISVDLDKKNDKKESGKK